MYLVTGDRQGWVIWFDDEEAHVIWPIKTEGTVHQMPWQWALPVILPETKWWTKAKLILSHGWGESSSCRKVKSIQSRCVQWSSSEVSHISLDANQSVPSLTETLSYHDFSDSWVSDTRPTSRRGMGHMDLKWSRIIPSTRETRDSIGRSVSCFGSLISQKTSGPWPPKRVRP